MSVVVAVCVFVLSLAVSVVSSVVLAKRIDQLGSWLRFSESLLGLLTALAADAPEVASAVTAIAGGHHDVGLGVVFGSNIFNLASLLGVSAITAGCVRARPARVWFDGGVGLLVAFVVAARLFGWIGGCAAVVLVGAVVVPYGVISALKPAHLERLAATSRVRLALERFIAGGERDPRTDHTPAKPSAVDLLGVVPGLVAIVVASIGMVRSAVSLGDRWGISHAVIGTLVLATVTGIPNMFAAIRLARRGRGTAVVSETLNSNSINLIVGALVPTLLFGVGSLASGDIRPVLWSIGMTILALVLMSSGGGLTRKGGLVLVGAYAGFAVIVLLWA